MLSFSYSQTPLSAEDLSRARGYIRNLYTIDNLHEAQDLLLDLIQSPGRLDQLLEKHSENLQEDLEKILATPSDTFFNRLFNLLWDKRSNNNRIFNNNTTLKWFFNLKGMQKLSFIRFDKTDKNRPAMGTQHRLHALFDNEDTYFINLVLAENQKLETEAGLRPLYIALSNLERYNSEAISYALIVALKSKHFYSRLEDYYLNSSEAFKQSPKVKSAMQLRYFFGYTSKIESLGDDGITNISIRHNNGNRFKTNKQTNKERGISNDDYGINYNLDYYDTIFSHNLITHHLNDLSALWPALSQLNFSGERIPEPNEIALYKRAKGLFERIQQLPHEIRTTLFQRSHLAVYSLALLTLKYERIANPMHTESTVTTKLQKGTRQIRQAFIALTTRGEAAGKELEIPFFRYLIKHLVEFNECSSNHTTEPNAPFIWNAYKACRLTTDEFYTADKMSAVNDWLKKIFHGPETSRTLTSLPETLFVAIFQGSEQATYDLSQFQADNEENDDKLPATLAAETDDAVSADSDDDESYSARTLNRSTSTTNQQAFFRHLERSGSAPRTSTRISEYK